MLIGDSQVVVVGVVAGDLLVAGPGAASLPSKKLYDSALVEFDGLVDSIDLCGTMDWLDGGAGDDLLIGDHRMLVAGIQLGAVVRGDAVLVTDIANAAGRMSSESQVDFDRLVDCISLSGSQDILAGGEGDDVLIGDHQAAVIGAVAGPLLVADAADAQAVTQTKASAQKEALVDFDNLVGSLTLYGGKDTLSGDGGTIT